MRAERLLAVVMLLKTHGRMTAAQLAAELDVSERTVLRDIDALSVSGIPVYAERGRHGGFALVPGYRTDLTGLTPAEAASLLAGGGRLHSPELASAMRKVAAAIPDAYRPDAMRAATRVLVRPEGFVRAAEPLGALGPVQQAVFDGRRIRMRYRRPGADAATERTVDPVGLVVAGDVWYLVANSAGAERMYRVSRMSDVEVLDERAERDDDVDLDAIWERRRTDFRAGFEQVSVRVMCADDRSLSAMQAKAYSTVVHEVGDDGTVLATVTFIGERHAINVLWSAEFDVEVLEPAQIRDALLDRARRRICRHGDEQPDRGAQSGERRTQ